ncbi:virulence factor TspB C-terminal domain-related protein [Paracidovorax wautersii]|uniref:virulence factor TspB C-terminal domain-related protein n=1 Tax=Paracidovorax wautersii TaxID=1177982 RepID=UPI0031D660AA
MDRFAKLVIALGLMASASAHAGYAQLAPPPGFTSSSSSFAYAASSNDAVFGRVLYQPAALTANVGGRAVQMSAAYRLASNAPRIAAAVIFANPALRTAAGIATWLGVGKIIWDAAEQVWKQQGDPSDGYTYSVVGAGPEQWTGDPASACQAWVAANPGSDTVTRVYVSNTATTCTHATYAKQSGAKLGEGQVTIASRGDGSKSCPVGWTQSPAGCLSPQLTQPQMVELLNPANQSGWPMPGSVPKELPPGTPLPVEQPYINPEPGANPASRPLFVPTGNPVQNPNYDPNAAPGPNNSPYLQPGVRVVPTPTTGSPWQVDMQPINRPVSSPDAKPDPSSEPSENTNDKPREDSPDLCQLHPDILACQKLDEPPDTDLPSSEKPISITQDSGWGSMSATCPPPRHIIVQGRDIPIPFDLFCQYMEGMRPIIVAMAWLSAAFILLGAREGD